MIKRVLKKKKFHIWLIVIYVLVLILVGGFVGGSSNRHNRSLKKNIQKVVANTAKEYGLENVEVVYVDDSDAKVVLSCDHMSELSYEQKVEFLLAIEKNVKAKGKKYSFYVPNKTVIYSDGNRYTSTASVSSIYENGSTIDPDTNMIRVNTNGFGEDASSSSSSSSKASSSSSKASSSTSSTSSSSKKKSCKGGVGCRSGWHPCHPMSDGYCNQCCKNSY